jgi:hypothetical protein
MRFQPLRETTRRGIIPTPDLQEGKDKEHQQPDPSAARAHPLKGEEKESDGCDGTDKQGSGSKAGGEENPQHRCSEQPHKGEALPQWGDNHHCLRIDGMTGVKPLLCISSDSNTGCKARRIS